MFLTYNESIPLKSLVFKSLKETHLLFTSFGIGKIVKIFPSKAENNKLTFLSVSIKSFSNALGNADL